ncbi:hypothetical protein COCNU_16G005820 [Cocos nucifera]|uniref:Uncharacterized protein n=1 Tax=Cocos nucifera TaxID=13894 RepID=A0A8K0J2A0_COCNU|nr:hypothetical protein COCNU_16G005820 [Cocos nucifera]
MYLATEKKTVYFFNRLSAASAPQDAPAAHSLRSKLDDCKMPASSYEFISNNTDSKSIEQQEEVQNEEVSILDLLNDDGPQGNPKGRSVPETHVAFSVEGLGKVGMETPAHSPHPHKRGFPSPPKASRCTRSSESLKSISYDLGLELNAIMHDVSMSIDDSLPEIFCNSRGLSNGMGFTRRMKFMDSSDVLDDDFLDGRKHDVLWKKTPSCSDGYPSIFSNSKNPEIYDYGFGDNCFQEKRTAVEAHKRLDIAAPSSAYFSCSTSEKEYDFLFFDQDRYPVLKERSDLDIMLNPPAWSFLKTEDSKDSMSLLSEESCSSAADSIQRRSKSKVPSECEPSSNFNCESVEQPSGPGIQFQKSEAHTLSTEDCKDSCSEHEESKYEEQLDGPKTRNPFEKVGETALPTEELPLHLKKSCIDDKSDLSDGRRPVQSEVSNRDPMKENLGPEKSFVSMGGNKTDAPCQVMLESYVLQFLCVQKVPWKHQQRMTG